MDSYRTYTKALFLQLLAADKAMVEGDNVALAKAGLGYVKAAVLPALNPFFVANTIKDIGALVINGILVSSFQGIEEAQKEFSGAPTSKERWNYLAHKCDPGITECPFCLDIPLKEKWERSGGRVEKSAYGKMLFITDSTNHTHAFSEESVARTVVEFARQHQLSLDQAADFYLNSAPMNDVRI
jgi:hypothetical protein